MREKINNIFETKMLWEFVMSVCTRVYYLFQNSTIFFPPLFLWFNATLPISLLPSPKAKEEEEEESSLIFSLKGNGGEKEEEDGVAPIL